MANAHELWQSCGVNELLLAVKNAGISYDNYCEGSNNNYDGLTLFGIVLFLIS